MTKIGTNTWIVLCLHLTPTERTRQSAAHSFSFMVGTHVWLEKFVEHFDEDRGNIETLVRDLTAKDVLQEHIEKMLATRDALFPKVEQNIKATQEKQKRQYLRRKGGFDSSFRNGDTVLRRNMLQNTKKGHKMEDQWNGPYTAEELDLKKGTCRLRGKKRYTTSKENKCQRTQNVQNPIQLSAASKPTIAAACTIIPAVLIIQSVITSPAGSTTKDSNTNQAGSTTSAGSTTLADTTNPTGTSPAAGATQTGSTSPAGSTTPASSTTT